MLVGVQGSLQGAFIESMSGTLIPAYEKSSQNMFKQLHEAFSVGIKECKYLSFAKISWTLFFQLVLSYGAIRSLSATTSTSEGLDGRNFK